MPNAWFYYVCPLGISTVFIMAGLVFFCKFARGEHDANGNKYGRSAGCAGIMFIGIGGTVGLAILLISPSPWARQRIFDHVFRTAPEQIKRFVIKPSTANQYQPLNKLEVVIDDPVRIRQIADILHAAIEVSPNHPHSKWTARVEIVTRDGSYYFDVDATTPDNGNGTLVRISSNVNGGGWNLGDARADGLEKILEDAAMRRLSSGTEPGEKGSKEH